MTKMNWLQFLIAVDQLGNTILGGWADETISSRAFRLEKKHKGWARARVAIDYVFGLFGDVRHCETACFSELMRTQLPAALRVPPSAAPTEFG